MNKDLENKLAELPSSIRVKKEDINKLIENSQMEFHVFWEKEMVCSFRLENGFTVIGRAACVDPANFNLDIGKELCFEDAIKQLWQLEGYRLQWKVYEEKLLSL